MPPRMLVVAGPPGSGKSTLLRPDEHAYFNADERARDLNHGSGRNISPEVRTVQCDVPHRRLESMLFRQPRLVVGDRGP